MDIIDPSIDPKEVELRDVDKKIPEKKTTKRKRLIVDVKITFCTHVGLGWRVDLIVFVTDCWSVCIYYLFVYQRHFCVASAVCMGLYGVCDNVCNTGDPYVCGRGKSWRQFLRNSNKHIMKKITRNQAHVPSLP